ncbi:MAG: hypothetical protein KHZ87_06230 [Clostridiales bacterium]|nr:hypothetical protein [Clostridiales bacterium]MBS5877432.1 hypothetical protein [Clostridiales bacterium]MDU0938819.1 Mur ligase family protein [Clostridiales bacterium]MDU1041541.1 Mur ligase family protein [Clostridiales bacterium]MDU3490634.1 Mur ligase family protein [Clostridiales bacterium]
MDFDEIKKFLAKVPQYISKDPRFSFGVDRARIMLDRIGHPEKGMKIIHAAGTNGKGSVCAYLASCLKETGARTGLFTSPHLIDIRERIRLDGEMIPVKDLTDIFNELLEQLEEIKKEEPEFDLAYFEYFFLIALIYFKSSGAEFVVLETGLGGLKDATNAIKEPIMSIITALGLEHTEILGDTVEKIAREKAGIIKSNTPVVVMRPKLRSVEDVITDRAKKLSSQVFFADDRSLKNVAIKGNNIDFCIENEYYKNVSFLLKVPAIYEASNALTALTAFAVLKEKGYIGKSRPLDENDFTSLKKALQDTIWEGRMQPVLDRVFIDGAHNPQGVDELIKCAGAICRGKRAVLLFSAVSDKNFDLMIRKLCECRLFDTFVVTKIADARAASDRLISGTFEKYTDKPVFRFENVKEAFRHALAIKKDYLFCAGSLYLIGELEEEINEVRKNL